MKSDTRSQNEVVFSRNDYKILIYLYNSECFTEINALPIKNIQNNLDLSQNKIRNALKSFKNVGFVNEGATIQRAKTYYVTKMGIKKIEDIIK